MTKLDDELLEAIKYNLNEMIKDDDELKEIVKKKNFNELFDYIDTFNAYEEEWNRDLFKPYFLKAWEDLQNAIC